MLSQSGAVTILGTHGTNISAFSCAWISFFMASVVAQITCVRVQLDGISYFLSISGVS